MDEDEAYSSEGDDSYDSGPLVETEVHNAPIAQCGLQQFIEHKRIVCATQHPYLNAGFGWISESSTNGKGRFGALGPEEIVLYHLNAREHSRLHELNTRLICEITEVFEELQYMYEEKGFRPTPALLSKVSTRYKTIMNSTLEDAIRAVHTKNIADDQEAEEQDEEEEECLQTLRDSVSVLLCTDAVYLPPEHNALRCDLLVEWVNTTDPRPSQQEGAEIMTARVPFLHPEFWEYIARGILRGLFQMTAVCLEGSGLRDVGSKIAQVVDTLCLILRSCPRASQYTDNTEDFKIRYRQWRGKLLNATKHEIADPDLSSAFRQLYELLKGDRDAILRQSTTWQECLASMALLYDPTGCRAPKDIKALFEMVTLSEDAAVAVDITLPHEVACASLCLGNIPKAISLARQADIRTATIIADLLEKAGILEDIRSGDLDQTLRDVLVLELGDHLIEDALTWRSAMVYWRTSNDAGLDRIQHTLPRIPLETQSQVDEILALCNDLDLLDEASEIESTWARKLESKGMYVDAVNSYCRAGNPRQIDRLNWNLFQKSLLNGKQISEDSAFTNALQAPQLMASRTISCLLAPVAALSQFYILKTNPAHALEACKYLAALIKLPDMPKQYTGILVAEMLSFFVPGHCHLSSRDIFDCLAAIEEFCESSEYIHGLHLLGESMLVKDNQGNNFRQELVPIMTPSDVISLVRLRIARALGENFYAD